MNLLCITTVTTDDTDLVWCISSYFRIVFSFTFTRCEVYDMVRLYIHSEYTVKKFCGGGN
jgi:hypothetical protein